MKNPLITIITVVYNDVTNIKKTIDSVIQQTYTNIEYIIIDGGSTDGTLEILNNYKKILSKIISEPDNGVYDAMNKGTRLAKGEWISYMNSGDQFNGDNILSKIFVEAGNEILKKDVIYSDVITSYKTIKKIRKAKKSNSLWRGQPFSHQALLVKASFAKRSPYKLKYSIIADYDFLYSIYNDSAKFYYYEKPIAIVDITSGISKTANFNMLYKDFYEINKNYTSTTKHLLVRFMFFIHYLYALTRRYYFKKNKRI